MLSRTNDSFKFMFMFLQGDPCSRYLNDVYQHPSRVVLHRLQLDLDAAFWRYQAGHLLLHAPVLLDHILRGAPHGTVHVTVHLNVLMFFD